MTNITKTSFLHEMGQRFGGFEKFGDSLSLFKIKGTDVRIYVRYSKTHERQRTWYGLRKSDLELLQGYPSLICFLWDKQKEPLLIPYADTEISLILLRQPMMVSIRRKYYCMKTPQNCILHALGVLTLKGILVGYKLKSSSDLVAIKFPNYRILKFKL